jgi:hypothetical protein
MEGASLIMSDYGKSINISDYKYMRPVYFSNKRKVFTKDIVAKLVLDKINFNFELAKVDGTDFRLLNSSGNTLNMWVASWSKERKYAVLFFSIPYMLGSSSVSFSAYWGNDLAEDVSNPDSLNFLLYESFSSLPLSSLKWGGSINSGISSFGYLLPSNNSFITKTNPLLGKNSWVIEAGIFCNFGYEGWSSNKRAVGFGFEGTENNLMIGIVHQDRIIHDSRDYTLSQSIKTNGGLEAYSYNDVVISYYEPEDCVVVSLQNRPTFNNVEHKFYRKVEGNTRINNVRIYGRDTVGTAPDGAYPSYISWFVIRDYEDNSIGLMDGRDLYVDHEYVSHQIRDYRIYGDNIISDLCRHSSSFGGNPYNVSNNYHEQQEQSWVSDLGTSSISSVDLTFYVAWSSSDVSIKKKHYDSGHEYYYGAIKLSNNDNDLMGRNQWKCTSSSGWAALGFETATSISSLGIKTVISLTGRPRNFIFYGSNVNPNVSFDDAIKLAEGTFSNLSGIQFINFNNEGKYTFYILKVLNTYGGNIIIDEWYMIQRLLGSRLTYASQLRLHPSTFGTLQYNFPKEISLVASNDGANWSTLIPWIKTYTPFLEHTYGNGLWQIYSFINKKGFYIYRLKCRGNWAADNDIIAIGSLSVHELIEDSYSFRVLDGYSNYIKQIWADSSCSIDDYNAVVYVANNKLSKISNNKLVGSVSLPDDYEDFNVVSL